MVHCDIIIHFFKIENCNSDEEISVLYDDARFSSIIDRSGWPTESVINMKCRFEFVSRILIEELFDKRLPALQKFREGLDHFGLLQFLKKKPDGWKPYFVNEDANQPLTADKFLSLLTSNHNDEKERRAYFLLVRFVKESECLSGKKYAKSVKKFSERHLHFRKRVVLLFEHTFLL